MQYDVIVAGAGPAGSTAARECASRGLSVLMLDKAEFPRDKPCGGAITMRTAGLLPFDIAPVVERQIFRVQITENRTRGFTRDSAHAVAYMTQRRHLDTFLSERAVDAGAIFRQHEAVRQVQRHPDQVDVRTTSQSYQGRTLVVADGANGKTAELASVKVNTLHGIAIEGNITPRGGLPPELAETLHLDFGGLPGGYGWLFPKGDHVNIGLGGWRYVGPVLRSRLDELVRFYGYDPSELWGLRGHLLPLRQRDSSLVDGNVLLVGDAAGLLDPLTAEGIYAAIWSGRAAAQEITEYLDEQVPDLDGYRRELEHVLIPELRISRQLHDIFHLWPGLIVGVERRTSIFWKVMVNLLRGEANYLAVTRKLGRIWPIVEFMSDLVRVTPPLRHLAGLRDPLPPERFFGGSAHHPSPHL